MLPFVPSLPDPNATLEIATNGLQPRILKMLEPVDAATPATLKMASQAVGRLFAEASPFPKRSSAPSTPVTRHSALIPYYHPIRRPLSPCVPRLLSRTGREPPSPASRRPTSTSKAQRPSWKTSGNAGRRCGPGAPSPTACASTAKPVNSLVWTEL